MPWASKGWIGAADDVGEGLMGRTIGGAPMPDYDSMTIEELTTFTLSAKVLPLSAYKTSSGEDMTEVQARVAERNRTASVFWRRHGKG